MKTIRAAVVGVVFVIGCAVGGAASHFVVPPVRAGTNPTRWEYACLQKPSTNPSNILTQSNQLGTQGWEMVTAAAAGEGFHAEWVWCFKRALP